MSTDLELEEEYQIVEVLPEIEITEILGLDKILARNPTFVALSPEDIHGLIYAIFQEARTAQSFVQLHRDVVSRDAPRPNVSHLLPVLAAERQETDEVEWLQQAKEKTTGTNYNERNRRMQEHMFPLKATRSFEEGEEAWPWPSHRVEAVIGKGRTVLLSTAETHLIPWNGTVRKQGSTPPTAFDSIVDRIAAPTPGSNLGPVLERQTQEGVEAFLHRTRPPMAGVLSAMPGHAALEEILSELVRYGWTDPDGELTPDAWRVLRDHLASVKEDNDDDGASPKKSKKPKRSAGVDRAVFWHVLEKVHAQLQRLPLEGLQETTLAQYDAWQHASASDSTIGLDTPVTTVLEDLLANRVTLADVRAWIRSVASRDVLERFRAYVDQVATVDMEQIGEAMARMDRQRGQAEVPFRDPGPLAMDVEADVKHVRVGQDETEYQGTPQQAAEPEWGADEDADRNEADVFQAAALEQQEDEPLAEAFPDMPGVATAMAEAAREVWPFVWRVRQATGLPWDSMRWIGFLSAQIPVDAATLQTLTIAWWIKELLYMSVKGMLPFDPAWQGNPAGAAEWTGGMGPPVEPKERHGILPYVFAVCDMSPLTKEAVLETMQQRFDAEIRALQKEWSERRALLKASVLKNAETAENFLFQTGRDRAKSLYEVAFTRALRQLPGILARRNVLYSLSGCCQQPLEKGFQSDGDLSSNLRDMKKLLKKKGRWGANQLGLVPRGSLLRVPLEGTPTLPVEEMAVYVPTWNPATPADVSSATSDPMSPWKEWVFSDVLAESAVRSIFQNAAKGWDEIHAGFRAFARRLDRPDLYTKYDLPSAATVQLVLSCFRSVGIALATTARARPDQPLLLQGTASWESLKAFLACIPEDASVAIYQQVYVLVLSKAVQIPMNIRGITGELIDMMCRDIYDACATLLENGHLLTVEEQQATMTRLREQQKIDTLGFLDHQTVELRQTMTEMKKLGLVSYKELADRDEYAPPTGGAADGTQANEDEQADFTYMGENPDD